MEKQSAVYPGTDKKIDKTRMYIDLARPSSMVSNTTFKPEKMFKAYSEPASNRHLYVHIDVIKKLSPELAEELV